MGGPQGMEETRSDATMSPGVPGALEAGRGRKDLPPPASAASTALPHLLVPGHLDIPAGHLAPRVTPEPPVSSPLPSPPLPPGALFSPSPPSSKPL